MIFHSTVKKTTKKVFKTRVLSTKSLKVVIWLDVFLKSIKTHRVCDGHFSKSMCVSVAEPWGTEGNLGRQNEYSFHMEVRTLYARRMFREQNTET